MDSVALIAIGVLCLGVTWMCWTGRWRAWSRVAMLPSIPMLPGLGVLLLLGGLGLLLNPGPRDASSRSGSWRA